MNEPIRELFEEKVYPSFADKFNLNRKNNGEYASGVIEDHWQTFQEGFELAIKECMDTLAWHGEDDAVSKLEWFKINKLGMK